MWDDLLERQLWMAHYGGKNYCYHYGNACRLSTILTPRNINILLTPSGKKLSVTHSGSNAAESWVDYRSSSGKRYAVPSINRLAS